ncbi:MAG: hypothetical protein IOC58_06350 [Methylobacterium sp.]|jgi:molybdopterin biosynthesis enzyme|nr:hypothetical protein [Methylobacterium sp.]MCA3612781.1 hypothetical protein [Methylobacterium sp.]MCA3623826.1 hypothetical protein [Methylobacterium sp.]
MTASRLLSLAEILPSGLAPVAAVEVHPDAALGAIAAEDVLMAEGWPRMAVAREPGYAVRSRMLIGATAYEPALLPKNIARLAAGDALPDGADAVLPAPAVVASPMGLEAFATICPGEGIRRQGQDWPAGRLLLREGSRIGPLEQALLLAMKVPATRVRRAAVSLDRALPDAVCHLLAGWAGALGLMITGPAQAQFRLEAGPPGEASLALRPGRFGALHRDAETIRLAIPPDLAEATGLWHAVALPVLASLSGARPVQSRGRLAGKLVSSIGFTELAFLRREGEAWLPLETGDCTLATLAQAQAVSLIPAGSEGQPAGAEISLLPLGGAFSTMNDRILAR